MSYIDLLFPREELEALGNKWPEPASKRRRLDLNAGLARGRPQPQQQQQLVRLNNASQFNQRRHTHSTPSYQRSNTALSSGCRQKTIKRSNSDVELSTASTPSSTSTKSAATSKSCLPSFIEPSLLKNYLQHLHPSDRSRYSIPNSPEPETQPQRLEASRRPAMHHEHEEDSCSPASLVTDNSSSVETYDSCPTPTPGIYEQLRDTPFGYLIHGLRLTAHEKDLVEGLLSPTQIDMPPPPPPPPSASISTCTKRKAGGLGMGFDLENYQDLDQALIQRIFTPEGEKSISEFGYFNSGYQDTDVHSSGLSPQPQMEEDEEHDVKEEENETDDIPVMSTRGFAISVNDFFDLDEASGFTELAYE